MQTILTTARLRLREMHAGDLDFMAEMLGDAEVMRYYPKVCTRDEAAAAIERNLQRYRDDGQGLWLVEDLHTSQPLGRCGMIRQVVAGKSEWEIGWMIHRPHQRQGYATEAALGIKQFALETLGLPHVISLIRPENVPSAGVARKLGMQPWFEVMHYNLLHGVFRVDRAANGLQK